MRSISMTSYSFIGELIAILWSKNWKKKLFFALTILLTVLVIIGNIAIPLLLQQCVALLSLPNQMTTYIVPLMLILYGICWTSSNLLSQLREIIVFKISEECLSILNLRIFTHLHSLDMSFHYERQTGNVMSLMSRTQSVFVFILWGFLYIGPTLIEIIIAAGIIFYWYGPLYSILLLLILASYGMFTFFAHKFVIKAEEAAQEQESLSATYMVDSLLNAETVKYFNNRQHELNRFKSLATERQNALVKEHNQRQLIFIGQSIIAGCGLTLFSWISGTSVVSNNLQISDFVLINSYFLQFILPLVSFGFYARSFKKNINVLRELIKLLEIKPQIVDSANSVAFLDKEIGIEFHNVSFCYDNKLILDSVSFIIPKGKTVAIVGTTGAGKSTIARLLYRLYDTWAGHIFINGTEIKQFQQETLQKVMGVVPQDTILFNNSIYYNIAYGKLDASEQEVKYAAQQAGLEIFIRALPSGYQTIVGERGLKLSGGEKQRIAIARVILKNPLLYIFDEATASLDTVTEKQIQDNLEKIGFGSTKIIIAHRLSTVLQADEIILLHEGKIAERGTHQSLLQKNGHYHSLWNQKANETAVSE